jgi:hypothetical protein
MSAPQCLQRGVGCLHFFLLIVFIFCRLLWQCFHKPTKIGGNPAFLLPSGLAAFGTPFGMALFALRIIFAFAGRGYPFHQRILPALCFFSKSSDLRAMCILRASALCNRLNPLSPMAQQRDIFILQMN